MHIPFFNQCERILQNRNTLNGFMNLLLQLTTLGITPNDN